MIRIQQLVLLASTGCLFGAAQADDWPQWRGPGRDSVWHESGTRQVFPRDGLKIRWRAPITAGHSSPIVGNGRVYITDSIFDSSKRWERVHCFDEKSGRALWMHSDEASYPGTMDPNNPAGPVPTPVCDRDSVFVLGATSQLSCLNARTGAAVWKKDLVKEYQVPGDPEMTASPLLEGDRVIVVVCGKPNACVLAFDKRTGKEAWRALDDPPHAFSSPMVFGFGGKRHLVVWTPRAITSLNPATGETWWREELITREDYAVVTPTFHDGLLLVSGLALRFESEKVVPSRLWPEAKELKSRVLSFTSVPLILGEHVFTGNMAGKLVCLDAHTGKQIWETDQVTAAKHCAALHLTLNGDSVLIFTDQGNLIRARLDGAGYHELSRAHLIDPDYPFGGRDLVWAPPAFANGHVFARNNKEIVCASLKAEP